MKLKDWLREYKERWKTVWWKKSNSKVLAIAVIIWMVILALIVKVMV